MRMVGLAGHTVNLTEQFAQVAVVGPNSRKLLEKLGSDMTFRAEALTFMGWTQGRIGGFDARVFRISFSGELSFEVAVPASQGRAFWDALIEAGAEWNATALRHRGAAHHARREGLHHDRG